MPRTDTRDHIEPGEEHEAVPAATITLDPPTTTSAADGELTFQRCLWCGTAAYRRSSCRACGSMAFRREPSTGCGVVVRRNGPVPHRTWFVAMDEGFTLVCQVTRSARVTVGVGARVSVVRGVALQGRGMPVVEPADEEPTPERWW